jgi:hypothetical protein
MTIPTSDIMAQLNKRILLSQSVMKSLKQIKSLESDHVKNVYDIARLLDSIRGRLADFPTGSEERTVIDEWLNSYSPALEINKRELHDSFGKALNMLLEKQEIQLVGQYPELKADIFTIKIDFKMGQCSLWYGPEQELLGRTKLDPGELSKRIDAARSQLSSALNEDVFLEQVHSAYLHVIRNRNRPEGERAEIVPVLNELVLIKQDNRFRVSPSKETFKEYTRAQFSFDLFRLSQRKLGTKSMTLVGAVRSDTSSRSGFIWIPSDGKGNGSSCGYVCFKEVANGPATLG